MEQKGSEIFKKELNKIIFPLNPALFSKRK
jgi:hypothetical protein